MLADDGGAPSGNAWWAQPVPDNWLETLLDAAYCGPDAVWPLDETALGGLLSHLNTGSPSLAFQVGVHYVTLLVVCRHVCRGAVAVAQTVSVAKAQANIPAKLQGVSQVRSGPWLRCPLQCHCVLCVSLRH